jgi:hypothetical protein
MHNNIVYFNEKFCQITYDTDSNIITARWYGYPLLANIQRGMEVYLDIMQNHQCNKLLSDLGKAKGTFTVANDWIANDWMPRALRVGYRACAMVYPDDVFTKFALKELNQKYEKARLTNFVLKYFHKEEDALLWLMAI